MLQHGVKPAEVSDKIPTDCGADLDHTQEFHLSLLFILWFLSFCICICTHPDTDAHSIK